MYLLQIEHPVPNYEGWKQAFDADPLDRKGSGVKRYTIYRTIDDPNYVLVELVFEDRNSADEMLAKLQKLWNQVAGLIISGPKARLVEPVESKDYRS